MGNLLFPSKTSSVFSLLLNVMHYFKIGHSCKKNAKVLGLSNMKNDAAKSLYYNMYTRCSFVNKMIFLYYVPLKKCISS